MITVFFCFTNAVLHTIHFPVLMCVRCHDKQKENFLDLNCIWVGLLLFFLFVHFLFEAEYFTLEAQEVNDF